MKSYCKNYCKFIKHNYYVVLFTAILMFPIIAVNFYANE